MKLKKNVGLYNGCRSFFIFFIFLLCFLFAVPVALSASPGWYDVTKWERAICSQWGGTSEAQTAIRSSGDISLSHTTIALQGKREIYANEGDALMDVTQVYLVSYYVHPTTGAVPYTLQLVHGRATTKTIMEGTASLEEPAVGFYTEAMQRRYEKLRLVYGEQYLEVPLVDIYLGSD